MSSRAVVRPDDGPNTVPTLDKRKLLSVEPLSEYPILGVVRFHLAPLKIVDLLGERLPFGELLLGGLAIAGPGTVRRFLSDMKAGLP